MPKLPEFQNKPIKGIDEKDWGKYTVGYYNIREAAYAKNDFLALNPELVAKLAEKFKSTSSMINFKGDNEKQIQAAGRLIAHNKMPRPEWFTGEVDYETRTANFDYKARAANIDYKQRSANTDQKARGSKISKKISKPISQFDLEGNFIRDWDSASIAGKTLNKKDGSLISMCCKGRVQTAYGYIWKFKGS